MATQVGRAGSGLVSQPPQSVKHGCPRTPRTCVGITISLRRTPKQGGAARPPAPPPGRWAAAGELPRAVGQITPGSPPGNSAAVGEGSGSTPPETGGSWQAVRRFPSRRATGRCRSGDIVQRAGGINQQPHQSGGDVDPGGDREHRNIILDNHVCDNPFTARGDQSEQHGEDE